MSTESQADRLTDTQAGQAELVCMAATAYPARCRNARHPGSSRIKSLAERMVISTAEPDRFRLGGQRPDDR